MKHLPVPLGSLRAFEAISRHGSIKRAAHELNVTPSAVSHQLHTLEDALGLKLMSRTNTGLELTHAGRALAPELTAGFTRIVDAVAALREERTEGPLRLSILPTFALHWLSPRLGSYPFGRRGFDLLISSSQTAVDLTAGEADAGIRHGRGAWPGLVAELLFEETVTLLGSPGLVGSSSADRRDALARVNLFLSQHRMVDFERWNASLPEGPIATAGVTFVDSVGLALRAALDGAGITLAGRELVDREIAGGQLLEVFDHRVPTGTGYYLVYPEVLSADRRLANVREWFLQESRSARRPPDLIDEL